MLGWDQGVGSCTRRFVADCACVLFSSQCADCAKPALNYVPPLHWYLSAVLVQESLAARGQVHPKLIAVSTQCCVRPRLSVVTPQEMVQLRKKERRNAAHIQALEAMQVCAVGTAVKRGHAPGRIVPGRMAGHVSQSDAHTEADRRRAQHSCIEMCLWESGWEIDFI